MKLEADGERATCSDGTVFSLWSEHSRGEPRFYLVMRRRPGEEKATLLWDTGSYTKRTVIRRIERMAREHEASST